MVIVLVLTITQLSIIYGTSDFAGVSPATVPVQDFAESQKDMSWYSFLNMRQVFVEQGSLFILNAALLYTAIFFLVSIMNDLMEQNNLMYIEGSGSMENEKARLKIIMTVFGTSYLVRAAFDLVIGVYFVGYQDLSANYPGFFELLQSLYFVLTDLIPICSFFRMHHQVYREEQEPVQMQVNPEHTRAQYLQDTNEQYLQTVLLNIIEATESSEQERSESIHDSFNIHSNFSGESSQLYEAPQRQPSSFQ